METPMLAFRGIAAVLACCFCTGAVQAADLITVPIQSGAGAIPVADAAPFDWDRFYVGIYGVGQRMVQADEQLGIGLNLGVDTQIDMLLVGGEVALQWTGNDAVETAYGRLLSRVGLLVTDDVLVFAAAGAGLNLGAETGTDFLLGGGVEVAINDSTTLRAQYLHGFAIEGEGMRDQVTLGANFHF